MSHSPEEKMVLVSDPSSRIYPTNSKVGSAQNQYGKTGLVLVAFTLNLLSFEVRRKICRLISRTSSVIPGLD